ncbi:hypothetical protein VC83_09623 [Pseudogymnoascus destructans]|uniref:Uncharacterized protein n=1 Tax=Pseudogymnoascus destructans TaxID=655981 RepID=A0A2P6FGI9_9PEZI|nr:uncharacterized protein VC83_09623 [Pseudogymnoascus destructans]PQM43496.1 hypothetical protein VC83_09623 [Pseudogymnoascus destructans]
MLHIRNSPPSVNPPFSTDNVTIDKGSPTSLPYLKERIMMQAASHDTVLGILLSIRPSVVFASPWQSQGQSAWAKTGQLFPFLYELKTTYCLPLILFMDMSVTYLNIVRGIKNKGPRQPVPSTLLA